MFPLELLDTAPAEARRRADALLDAVGPRSVGTTTRPSCRVANSSAWRWLGPLPRGQPFSWPRPTGNLDGPTGARVLEALDRLQTDSGCTIVMVTHDPAIGARADVRIHLRDGQVERIEGADA